MKFQLRDVRPNPFRRMEKYPILPEKVDALKESIESTGFWENIVGREVGGKLEIAYGHHRLAALKAVYPATQEFDWRVRKLSDGTMIQMMTRENSETYKTNAAVLIESVRAAVQAYSRGLVTEKEMPAPDSKTNESQLRYAPNFTMGACSPSAGEHPYTAVTLGRFLGLTKKGGASGEQAATRLLTVLNALEMIELGVMSESQVRDMTITDLEREVSYRKVRVEEKKRLATEAKRTKEAAEAERIRQAEEKQKAAVAAKAAEEAGRKAEFEAKQKAAEEKARQEAE